MIPILEYEIRQSTDPDDWRYMKTERYPADHTTPVDTGRKLNVHKAFRRRPGRLLNVLCTFNLRLVSTGTKRCSKVKN